MANIRCPNCGKDNPDFLDACQFCQTPLQSESPLQIGDSPTKKNTGELEAILPDWLKDARQQSRESADDDAMEATITSKLQKDTKPDLLAGLASQSASDDDEVPDWLAGLNPVGEKESSTPSASKGISPSDFFAQFEQEESKPAPAVSESTREEKPSSIRDEIPPAEQKDELGGWFSQTSDQPDDALQFDLGKSQADEWKPPEPKESKEPEDLSWLHNLEASSKQASEPHTPQMDVGWMSNFDSQPASQPSDPQEDLGWLNNLGGISMPASDQTTSAQPASSMDDDLGWLNNLGGISTPASNEPAPAQPVPSKDDDLGWLGEFAGATTPAFDEPAPTIAPASSKDTPDWLKDFGGATTPASNEPASQQPVSSQEDSDWLKNLGGVSAAAPVSTQPELPQRDGDWLNNLGGTPATDEVPTSKPFADTGELNWLNKAAQQKESPAEDASTVSPFLSRGTTGKLDGITETAMPDWLKSATETPSMPPPGAASMDWFKAQEEQPPLSKLEPVSTQSDSPSSNNLSSISNQDVDSMFAVEMPDWLSQRPPESSESPSKAVASNDNNLAPVDLPSWVQAMRPVEAALNDDAEAETGELSRVVEKEGPLTGFRGLIPSAPIGSSRRPKAISLKLQATDEQQANAALLEKIIAGETTAHPVKSSSVISSQRFLRIAIAVLFWLVLGGVIGLGSQSLPIVAPASVSGLSNLVATIPDGSPVLIVMDYQPSLVGELEAASGPLLDQMALSRHTKLTFLSMSPNGSALVERLMSDTKLSRPIQPVEDEDSGLGYQLGVNYFNIGFLPGDSTGVLAFVENPKVAMPTVNVGSLSEFSAVVLLTDHAESSRMWVEQLEQAKQKDPALASQKLLVVSSAQSGPLLSPYVSSGQVDILINGLSEAAGYEYVNTTRPGIARAYWDAFGFGLMMAIALIVLGSFWSLVSGIRARRAEAELG